MLDVGRCQSSVGTALLVMAHWTRLKTQGQTRYAGALVTPEEKSTRRNGQEKEGMVASLELRRSKEGDRVAEASPEIRVGRGREEWG